MPILTGKGAQILKYIAENEPCTQYTAREKAKRWSSRTVWKQFQRLERDALIRRTAEGYEVTDWGFFILIPALRGSEMRRILRSAIEKYPSGHAEKAFGALLNQQRKKVDLEHEFAQELKKPNVFLLCRSDKDGKIAWTFQTWPALDLESGRFNLKVLKRIPSRRGVRWRTVDLR